jgi:glycosyltransferase involved in cell wall biosynthesis
MTSVSIIVPTYQCGQFLSQAIESVLAQTYKNYEIIIVDDGSTDNTQEVINRYSHLENIKIVRQSNQGPAAARNRGIKLSSGEYIAFLDADDLWLPTKLEKQIIFLEQHPLADMVYCDAYIFSGNFTWKKTLFNISPPASENVFERLFQLNFIPILTVVLRRNIFKTSGFFDESIIGPEDYDLWLRICQSKSIAFIQEPLAKYRVSAGQITKQKIRMIENEIKVKEKAFQYAPELLNLPNPMRDRGYFNLLIRISKLYLQKNQNQEAKQTLEKYKAQRGITFRYLAIRSLVSLPNTIQRGILMVWDRSRIKHGLEKNGAREWS